MKLKTWVTKANLLTRLSLLLLLPAASHAVTVSVPHAPIHLHGNIGWDAAISVAIPAAGLFVALSIFVLPAKERLKYIAWGLCVLAVVMILAH